MQCPPLSHKLKPNYLHQLKWPSIEIETASPKPFAIKMRLIMKQKSKLRSCIARLTKSLCFSNENLSLIARFPAKHN